MPDSFPLYIEYSGACQKSDFPYRFSVEAILKQLKLYDILSNREWHVFCTQLPIKYYIEY
jgi:hypothetical protein